MVLALAPADSFVGGLAVVALKVDDCESMDALSRRTVSSLRLGSDGFLTGGASAAEEDDEEVICADGRGEGRKSFSVLECVLRKRLQCSSNWNAEPVLTI